MSAAARPFSYHPELKPGPGQALLFDDFVGSSIDTNKWNVIDRDGDGSVNEQSAPRAGNVTLDGSSHLVLTAKNETFTAHNFDENPPHAETSSTSRDYSYGMIQQKTAPFQFGTVTVRYKIPTGRGLWYLPCWLLGSGWQASQIYTANGTNSWPADPFGEIDVVEIFDNNTTQINCMIQIGHGGFRTLPGGVDAANRWVRSRLIWTTSSCVWQFDPEDGAGNPVGWTTLETQATNIPQSAMYIVISMPVGGNGGGGSGPTFTGPFPSSQLIDSIQVTQP